jgi:ATP/maltotriose-dependent transcriptional regulator MalT
LALHAVDKAIRGESRDEVLDLALAALADGRLPNDETSDGVSYYLAAAAMAYAEELERAEAALTTAVQDAESRGSVLGLATASHLRSLTNLMRGRLADAAADARNVLAVQKHGWLLGLSKAHAVLATVACEQGDLERAAAHIDDAQSGMPADAYRPALLAARGRLQLCRGETEQARDSFRECGELAERAGVTNPAVIAWRADLGVATAVIGDWNEGKRLIEDELARARAFGAPGPIGRALRALASIHAPQLALEILHDAVETLETSQAEAERAAALIDFGAALRRSGRRRDAISPLREGLHLARHCGAAVLVERAVRETTAAGARPRRSALYGEAALTERELQVAALAADGLSNREIADTLVVTVKTVEWHLRHVYEKLGIRSRRELAATLEPGQRSPG